MRQNMSLWAQSFKTMNDRCPMSIKVLNRDLWSNAGVKAIVGEHFVFWQQYKVSQSFLKISNLVTEFAQ